MDAQAQAHIDAIVAQAPPLSVDQFATLHSVLHSAARPDQAKGAEEPKRRIGRAA